MMMMQSSTTTATATRILVLRFVVLLVALNVFVKTKPVVVYGLAVVVVVPSRTSSSSSSRTSRISATKELSTTTSWVHGSSTSLTSLSLSLSSSSSSSTTSGTVGHHHDNDDDDEIIEIEQDMVVDAIVCGGGPAGLLCSIMLAQTFPQWKNIIVYDKPPPPPPNSTTSTTNSDYNVALFERGIKTLQNYDVWDNVVRNVTCKVIGSGTWKDSSSPIWKKKKKTKKEKMKAKKETTSDNESSDYDDITATTTASTVTNITTTTTTTSSSSSNNNNITVSLFRDRQGSSTTTNNKDPIYSIPRDKLVSVLREYITDNYSNQIQLYYDDGGYEVIPLNFSYHYHQPQNTNNNNNNNNTNHHHLQDKDENDDDGHQEAVLVDIIHHHNHHQSFPSNNITTTTTTTTTTTSTTTAHTRRKRVVTKFLVGADGVSRTVANRMMDFELKERRRLREVKGMMAFRRRWINSMMDFFYHRRRIRSRPLFHVKRYVDNNPRVYKTIQLQLPPSTWRFDLQYAKADSAKMKYSIIASPSNDHGKYCGIFLMKQNETKDRRKGKTDDVGDDAATSCSKFATSNTNPKELRQLFDTYFTQFSELIDDKELMTVATKPPSTLPSYSYATPRLHTGRCTVLVGDSAHSIKPYVGQGVNTAFEDVQVLGEALQSSNTVADALEEYSKRRAPEAKALVELSKVIDRPGLVGFISILVPFLMDALCNKISPSFFAPPIPILINDHSLSFAQIARQKRRDRIIQVSAICLILAGLLPKGRSIIRALALAARQVF